MTASSVDIDQEYKRTLRTRSYQNMLKEVGEQFRKLGNPTVAHEEEEEEEPDEEEDEESTAPSAHLREDFLVPSELDQLVPADGQARLRGLLRDYLDSGLRASAFCYQLLESIAGARANHRAVQRIVEQRRGALLDLARIARLDNPLSQPRLADFLRHHGGAYAALVPRLRSLQRGFAGFSRTARARRRRSSLDAAARGAYGLHREFDTVGRLLARLNDEFEHDRWVAKTLLHGGSGGGLWEEAAGELRAGEGRLLEQLQELEERVLLCLLTITRAWKLLLTQGLVSLSTNRNH